MSPRLFLALTAVALGFAAIAVLLIPNPGTRPVTPAGVSEAAHEAHAGGTGVSSTIDATADAAFLADLFEGAATDLPAQQLADLVAIGHRVCDLGQPRSEWLASLTAPGPHAYTADEAGKILDTATAAYCPQAAPVAAAVPSPTIAAPSTVAAAPNTPVAAPSTVEQPETVSTPAAAPSVASDTQQEQLPEERIGREIDCPNGTVGHIVDTEGGVDC